MVRTAQARVGLTGGRAPSHQSLGSCEGEQAKRLGSLLLLSQVPRRGVGAGWGCQVSEPGISSRPKLSQEGDAPWGAEPALESQPNSA